MENLKARAINRWNHEIQMFTMWVQKSWSRLVGSQNEFYAVRYLGSKGTLKQREFDNINQARMFFTSKKNMLSQPVLMRVYHPSYIQLAREWIVWFFRSVPYWIFHQRYFGLRSWEWAMVGGIGYFMSVILTGGIGNASACNWKPGLHRIESNDGAAKTARIYCCGWIRRGNLRCSSCIPGAVAHQE